MFYKYNFQNITIKSYHKVTFLSSGIDGSWQFGVRHCRLGSDDYVSAVPCGPQRDRLPDTATGSGNEQRTACKLTAKY